MLLLHLLLLHVLQLLLLCMLIVSVGSVAVHVGLAHVMLFLALLRWLLVLYMTQSWRRFLNLNGESHLRVYRNTLGREQLRHRMKSTVISTTLGGTTTRLLVLLLGLLLVRLEVLALLGRLLRLLHHMIQLLLGHLDDGQLSHLGVSNDCRLR